MKKNNGELFADQESEELARQLTEEFKRPLGQAVESFGPLFDAVEEVSLAQ